MTYPLKKAELVARIRAGSVALAFDTNAVEAHSRFLDVCDAVAVLNSDRPAANHIRLFVSAVVYAEKILHMRQGHSARRGAFSEKSILETLATKNIRVIDFESRHGNEVSLLLHQRYPTREEWLQAKRELYIQKLGIQNLRQQVLTDGKHCSGTNDWLIAGHARSESHILITDDTGEEFTALSERTPLETLENALGELGVWVPKKGRH